ncbi:MAG: hypothetical protein ABJD11_09985 [Gemmatimonadota bacterium]
MSWRVERRDILAFAVLVSGVTGLGGCRGSMSPLSNRIEVGKQPYAIFVADGEGASGDLFAVEPGGGVTHQITFTRLDESAPALDPHGVILAFVRRLQPADTNGGTVWALNLLSGQERRLVGADAGIGPVSLGWSADGTSLYVRGIHGDLLVAAPPAASDIRRLSGADSVAADSAFEVLVGTPVFARVLPCKDRGALCVVTRGDTSTVLADEATGPFRWGSDSLGYFIGDQLVVRPLGGGATRRLNWTPLPHRPRSATFFAGAAE